MQPHAAGCSPPASPPACRRRLRAQSPRGSACRRRGGCTPCSRCGWGALRMPCRRRCCSNTPVGWATPGPGGQTPAGRTVCRCLAWGRTACTAGPRTPCSGPGTGACPPGCRPRTRRRRSIWCMGEGRPGYEGGREGGGAAGLLGEGEEAAAGGRRAAAGGGSSTGCGRRVSRAAGRPWHPTGLDSHTGAMNRSLDQVGHGDAAMQGRRAAAQGSFPPGGRHWSEGAAGGKPARGPRRAAPCWLLLAPGSALRQGGEGWVSGRAGLALAVGHRHLQGALAASRAPPEGPQTPSKRRARSSRAIAAGEGVRQPLAGRGGLLLLLAWLGCALDIHDDG